MYKDSSELTESQKEVYRFIKESFYESGSVPTLREICHYMGWKAVGSAQSVIRALTEKKLIKKDPMKSRGLQLTDAPGFRAVPILGSAPAGIPLEAIESHEGDALVPQFIRGPVFAIRVQGDSMQGAGIEDDDLVIVRQTSSVESGDIVVALLGGETTIKRFLKKGKAVWLYPENKKYKPKKIEDPSFRILGKVVGLHRYWSVYQ